MKPSDDLAKYKELIDEMNGDEKSDKIVFGQSN